MHAIDLIDAEALRAKLKALRARPDSEILKALAYYDELVAQGHKAALYMERGQLVVGTLDASPSEGRQHG